MKKIILPLLVALGFSGCAKNYRDEFLRQAKAKGWTEKQQLAALYYSYRLQFLEKKDGVQNKVNYAKLSKTRVREKLDEALQGLDDILSYKNKEDVRYVDTFGLRPHLEREEEVLKAVRDRVRAAELFDQFRKLTGQLPTEHGNKELLEKYLGYNAQEIFLSTDPIQSFPFTLAKIEAAEANGTLKIIEGARTSVIRKLDRKEQNPATPDDPNNFTWKTKITEIELVAYKVLDVEKPADNLPDYIEGHRLHGGHRESKPSLKIFFFKNDPKGVLILDTDQEGETGFGLPDIVSPLENPDRDVSSIMKNEELLKQWFSEKKKQKRTKPKKDPIFVEIAKVKEKEPLDFWEMATTADGWKIPFQYKNLTASNYRVSITMAKIELRPGEKPPLAMRIEYIKKIWAWQLPEDAPEETVVEYFKAKPPYNEQNILSASVLNDDNPKKIAVIFENGLEQQGLVTNGKNIFIEDEPVMIEYTEGEKRWRLKKSDGSKVFDKRKEVSLEETGEDEENGENENYGQ